MTCIFLSMSLYMYVKVNCLCLFLENVPPAHQIYKQFLFEYRTRCVYTEKYTNQGDDIYEDKQIFFCFISKGLLMLIVVAKCLYIAINIVFDAHKHAYTYANDLCPSLVNSRACCWLGQHTYVCATAVWHVLSVYVCVFFCERAPPRFN